MDIYQLLRELGDVIKKYKKLIGIVVGVIILIFAGIQAFRLSNGQSDDTDKDGNEQVSNPAQFDIYIEDDVEGTFLNSYLIEIFLTQDEIVDQIESETDVSIQPVLEEYAQNDENEAIYTEEDPINVERHRSSHVLYVTIDVGNEEENLSVAEFYYNYLQNTDDAFFENKDIFFVEEPTIPNNDESAPNALNSQETGIISLNLIIQFIAAIVAGLVLGILVAIFKVILSDRIQYGFTYGWNLDDNYISFKDGTPVDKVSQSVSLMTTKNSIILSQFEIDARIIESMNNQNDVSVYHNLEEKDDHSTNTVIIVIQRNKTTKKWYREQRRYLKLLDYENLNIIEVD